MIKTEQHKRPSPKMAISLLLPSEIKLVRQALIDANLDPKQFEMTALNELHVKHRETGFYFDALPHEVEVSGQGGRYKTHAFAVAYVPHKGHKERRPTVPGGGSNIIEWGKVVLHFKQWLGWLSEEIDVSDPWEEAMQFTRAFPEIEFGEELFLPQERKVLQAKLLQLEQKIEASALPEAAIRELTAAIKEASAKSESMTKKDWLNLFTGTMVNTMVTIALNPEQSSLVLGLIKSAFASFRMLLG